MIEETELSIAATENRRSRPESLDEGPSESGVVERREVKLQTPEKFRSIHQVPKTTQGTRPARKVT